MLQRQILFLPRISTIQHLREDSLELTCKGSTSCAEMQENHGKLSARWAGGMTEGRFEEKISRRLWAKEKMYSKPQQDVRFRS